MTCGLCFLCLVLPILQFLPTALGVEVNPYQAFPKNAGEAHFLT